MRPHTNTYQIQAFSLLELLAVISVIILISAIAVPAFNGMSEGVHLDSGAQLIRTQLNLARQTAMLRNYPVEVRFYLLGTESRPNQLEFRAIQLWKVLSEEATVSNNQGSATEKHLPIDRKHYLPGQAVIGGNQNGAEFSPSLTGASIHSGTESDSGQSIPYHSFRFRSNGSTDLDAGSDQFLTLWLERDAVASVPPANFASVVIDPINGRTRILRP